MHILKGQFLAILVFVLSTSCGTPPNEAVPTAVEVATSSQQPDEAGGGFAGRGKCQFGSARHEYHHPASPGRPENPQFMHEVVGTTIGEVRRHLRGSRFPAFVPEWVTCIEAEVSWVTPERAGSEESSTGGFIVRAFSGENPAEAPRALIFKMVIPSPAETPLPPGEWQEIDGRPGHYQDMRASRDEAGNLTDGVRIAWTREGAYFELVGRMDLQEALRMADSV